MVGQSGSEVANKDLERDSEIATERGELITVGWNVEVRGSESLPNRPSEYSKHLQTQELTCTLSVYVAERVMPTTPRSGRWKLTSIHISLTVTTSGATPLRTSSENCSRLDLHFSDLVRTTLHFHSTSYHPTHAQYPSAMPPRAKPKAVAETSYTPSTLPADHFLVRLGAPQGSNQFATEIKGEPKLVDMPARVRRLSFAARGECCQTSNDNFLLS